MEFLAILRKATTKSPWIRETWPEGKVWPFRDLQRLDSRWDRKGRKESTACRDDQTMLRVEWGHR